MNKTGKEARIITFCSRLRHNTRPHTGKPNTEGGTTMRTKHSKRLLSLLLSVVMLAGLLTVQASALEFSKGDQVLAGIEAAYSAQMREKIQDLFYSSDYSDFLSDKSTLRSCAETGVKSFPIANGDKLASSVVDRGVTVDWGWRSAGCFAYAQFFSYVVYGSIGAKDAGITVDKNDSAALAEYLKKNAQPGEHIRIKDQHSQVFLLNGTEKGKDGFYYADYWGGRTQAKDQYRVAFRSYDSFVKKYDGKHVYLYNAYETSEFAGTNTDPEDPVSAVDRDVVLVLDISGSMSGSRMDNTKTAAKRFVASMLDDAHDTQMALALYGIWGGAFNDDDGDGVSLYVDLTDDTAALNDAIDALYADGMTPMYGGLKTAGDLLAGSTAAKKAIVLMTDGSANEGPTGESGEVTTENGDVYFDSYSRAVYDLAREYIADGITIYTLGFDTDNQALKYTASMDPTANAGDENQRYYWNVTNENIDDIIFTYEDISETITTKASIIIEIQCPVDASVSLDGETLDRSSLTASFGKLTVNEVEDGYSYRFVLNDSPDYDLSIVGLDNGTMDCKVTYTRGDESQYREYLNIPVTTDTSVSTSATDPRADLALFVDEDGSEVLWVAGINETVIAGTEPDTFYAEDPDPADPEEPEPEPEPARGGGTYVQNYTLRFDTNGGTSVIPVTRTVGTTVDLTSYTTEKEGSTFGGWYADQALTRPVTSVRLTGSITVYAGWKDAAAEPGTTEPEPAEPGSDSAFPFTDVPADKWYRGDVEYVYGAGLMNGTGDTLFQPDLATSRAMIVTILHRIEGTPAPAGASPFGDVAGGSWYADAVAWAAENGIVKGVSDTAFDPGSDVTREQMAAILYRYAQYKGIDVSVGEDTNILSFNDMGRWSEWAVPALQWAVGADILNGTADGDLAARDNATRAQIAAVLHRFCEGMGD